MASLSKQMFSTPGDESAVMTGTVLPVDSGYTAFKANLDVMGAMRVGQDGTS